MGLLVSIALGGALGSVLRHGVSSLIARWLGGDFPWGILAVNVLGGLAIGVLAGLFAVRWQAGLEMRAFLTIGLLGGFTTFSAFSLEVALLIERGELGQAAAYVIASVAASVLALVAGLYLVRLMYATA